MENKNLIIGGGVVLAIIFLMSKKKAKPTASGGEVENEMPGGVGGGGGFGFPPPVVPTTTTTTKTTTTSPAVPTITSKGSGGSIVKCQTGYVYNGRACVKEAPIAQSTTDGRTAYQQARTASGGLTAAPTSGTTTTRPPAGSTAPPVSGGSTSRPVGGSSPVATNCPKGYSYDSMTRKCVKMADGEVGSGGMLFSGKEPLTLDNILC